MNIEPMKLREFGPDAPPPVVKPAKRFLPAGRLQGEVPPPPPPPPVFNEEQLKAAERESYKKGFLEGTQEGIKQAESEQAQIDRHLTAMLGAFAESVSPLLADYREVSIQLQRDMPKTALAIARKVAGAALAENASATIEDIAKRCVEAMIGTPKLTITVHESLAAGLERKLTQVNSSGQTPSEIVVIGNAEIPTSDCRIEWKHGAFARHTGQLWQEIDRVVGNMEASATYHAATHIDNLNKLLAKPAEQNPEPNPTTKE